MAVMRKRDDEEHELIEGIEIIEDGAQPDEDPEALVEVDDVLAAAEEAGEAPEAEDDAAEDDSEEEEDPEADSEGDPEADPEDEPEDDGEFYEGGEPARPAPDRSKVMYIAVTAALAVIALIVGYVAGSSLSGSSSSDGYGVSSNYITEDELDSVVATWTYDGATYTVTAQEAIESQYSLEYVLTDDGTYELTSADTILSYVRNQVLLQEAEALGITVSEDEVLEYSEDTLGSSDYEYIAEVYGVSEEQAELIITQMATIQALYDSVMPEVDATLPSAPEEPEDGDEDAMTEEYGAYIIELLGDEWDLENETWATTDGDYYSMLGDEEFTSESASYNQAILAYYAAYIAYSAAYSEASTVWTEYANSLYGAANITIYGLYA